MWYFAAQYCKLLCKILGLWTIRSSSKFALLMSAPAGQNRKARTRFLRSTISLNTLVSRVYPYTSIFNYSSIYSSIYLSIHLFIYLFIYSSIYSSIYLFIHLFIYLFIYSSINLSNHLFIYLFIFSYIHLLIYSYMHLFIY